MKAYIAKQGTGKQARVSLKLRDGSRISGYISEIKDKSFVLVSDQSGAATEIEYADARKAPRQIPKAVTYLIVGAAVVAFLAIVGYRARGH